MFNRGTKSKAWHGPQNYPVIVPVMFLVSVLVALVLLFQKDDVNPMSAYGLHEQKWNRFESLVQFNPEREFRNGTDLIWQIPNSPKGVLFLAHGCSGRAVNFWDRSSKCPKCVGLPEERLLVLHALARKFAVLTISSVGRCWTFGKEKLIVEDIIRWWINRQKLEKLPLVALGASSGGYFVSALANDLKFSSITLMIAEGIFDQMDIRQDYPPTLFVHMPKDAHRQQKITEFMEVLRNKGIDVAEIECMELPLSPTFLSDRIPGLTQTISARLFNLFREKGFIDENGYMKRDGRATHWKEAVEDSKTTLLKDWVHPVQEELNLAFAHHEMTSLQSEEIFKWVESHMT
ncbi:uncharacterized protein LOC111300590 [Durio zibethinus]|uniref:Uncharacterized protein LOC111300590 n=1 Tax=Durio zibethinus TaxID=66656 RepID=A0A6P5ZHE0_DURZI|nr:uncharacterized protein LOC111300590 [Durio zibethinus]XP_022751953.1 uncharacterized protein LOC111300590 [Durio zibethinus]